MNNKQYKFCFTDKSHDTQKNPSRESSLVLASRLCVQSTMSALSINITTASKLKAVAKGL